MAYFKVRLEIWCDGNPAESDLEETARHSLAARPFVPVAKLLPS